MKLLEKLKSLFKDNFSKQARENLQKNFLKKDDSEKLNDKNLSRKNQSMLDSQGVSDFSGSGYNGPGNVDREKRNSNMSQRNF